MKRYLLTLALIATTALGVFTSRADDTNAPVAAPAATPPPLPAASLDQRIAALEAYIANTDPTAPLKDTNGTQVVANTAVIGNPGPGHNAWLMTSTAFVLFMTLPGLALFYGGLVRRKNVLSVLAQCFLITGLVTILWVFVGYGMIFGGTGTGSDPAARHAAMAKEDVITGVVGSPTVDWMLNNVTRSEERRVGKECRSR